MTETFPQWESAEQIFSGTRNIGDLRLNISHGTSQKFADVRTHLRKVSKKKLHLIEKENCLVLFSLFLEL